MNRTLVLTGTGIFDVERVRIVSLIAKIKGVYSFEQIASWDTEQEVWIGTQMAFPKRVTNEEWVKQAKELLKNK